MPRLDLINRLPATPFPTAYAGIAYIFTLERPASKTGVLLLERIVAGSRTPRRARQLLVDAYIKKEQWPQALEHCKKLLDESSGPRFREHLQMGYVLSRVRDYNGALESCRKAVALKPESALGHSSLGAACEALGMLEEAEAEYRIAIELEHDSEGANYARRRLSHMNATFNR